MANKMGTVERDLCKRSQVQLCFGHITMRERERERLGSEHNQSTKRKNVSTQISRLNSINSTIHTHTQHVVLSFAPPNEIKWKKTDLAHQSSNNHWMAQSVHCTLKRTSLLTKLLLLLPPTHQSLPPRFCCCCLQH